ncbi:MAG TPA: KpsF/GutQ family sugar-phosphate isomerase [Alphaproteobacteria bacterium]
MPAPHSLSPSASLEADLAVAREVLQIEIDGLQALSAQLNEDFTRALDHIMQITGRVIITGVGKSGHVGKKIAATLASTGTPSFFVHPAEASHGDLGMITRDDIVLAISNRGEAPELANIHTYCKRFSVPMIGVTSRPQSTLATQADYVLLLPNAPEACPNQQAPTTSTTMTLALGDALAVALMKRRNFSTLDFKNFHPGGSLGGKLIKVADVMRQGDELPLVEEHMTVGQALPIMSLKRSFGTWGRAVIVDKDKNLRGYFSDGDIRRNVNNDLMNQPIASVMNKNPLTVDINAMAAAALALMNERQITELIVLDGTHVRGLVRLHDILAAGAA